MVIFRDLRYVEQQLLIRIALNILEDINTSVKLQCRININITLVVYFYCEKKVHSHRHFTQRTWAEAPCRGYLVPLVALVPRLEHQPAVSVAALVQALQLLHVDTLVQPVFQASLRGLVFPRAAAAVSVSVTVSVS